MISRCHVLKTTDPTVALCLEDARCPCSTTICGRHAAPAGRPVSVEEVLTSQPRLRHSLTEFEYKHKIRSVQKG